MTIHLRAIHCADTARSDVLARRMATAETAEKLRDEIEAERPSLVWPLPGRVRHGH